MKGRFVLIIERNNTSKAMHLLVWGKKRFTVKLTYLIILTFLIYTVFHFISLKMENDKPKIQIALETSIGNHHIVSINIVDEESGIRKVVMSVLQDDLEITLAEKELCETISFKRKKQKNIKINAMFSTSDLNLKDGNVKFKVVAWDSSFRNFGKGNKTCLEIEAKIDTIPPKINVLENTTNVSQGGSGVVVYKLSEKCLHTGVLVGDNFFPGYSGYFEDSLVYISFFALKYDQNIKTKISLLAIDNAGNQNRAGLIYKIQNKNFSKDNIILSDQFLNWKMPEFSCYFDTGTVNNLIDTFLKVNNETRELNGKQVLKICSNTEKQLFWEGSFLHLPGSISKAGFADDRRYFYDGIIVDKQVHLGIDMASYAKSPVPCANTGKVTFKGNLGIYGNSVIIDHGFGIFSLYSHLSKINAKKHEIIRKGETIGLTGSTGLAGGDHLHFAMIINNTYVNPIEWWDKAWVKNNITSKIVLKKSMAG